MEDICRLCCSLKYVNNYIFDDENALYLKMSLYMPFKVFKNDRLPQKICDKCSCKVNDLYQFCSEAIEVQTRLRGILLPSSIRVNNSIDLTLIKENVHSPSENSLLAQNDDSDTKNDRIKSQTPIITYDDQSTQTDNIPESDPEIKVKEEPKPPTPLEIKTENNDVESDFDISNNIPSDDSEDESLINIKKKKKETKRVKEENSESRRRGRKRRLKEWEILVNALPEGTIVVDKSQVPSNDDLKVVPKTEIEEKPENIIKQVKIKKEVNDSESFHCCICAEQCYTRSEMIQHYRRHATDTRSPQEPPQAPPPPDVAPLRCPRCSRVLDRGSWSSHWRRHWERDHRPYRCALCEKTFREPYQILKHGITHKLGEEGNNTAQPPEKRFVCDLCPEVFVYMRYLLAHRTRAHPEASSRALTLRCAQCSREFAHLNSLRRHLRAHSGERNFLCNVCGKALSSREHLKFHIRIHTGYKPNVCKTCGKGFVKKCNLTLHERVHSGEKPHVCSHCGKAFSQRSTLVIHERYHSGARPYVCGLCGRGFVAKGLLSMHLKTTCI